MHRVSAYTYLVSVIMIITVLSVKNREVEHYLVFRQAAVINDDEDQHIQFTNIL